MSVTHPRPVRPRVWTVTLAFGAFLGGSLFAGVVFVAFAALAEGSPPADAPMTPTMLCAAAAASVLAGLVIVLCGTALSPVPVRQRLRLGASRRWLSSGLLVLVALLALGSLTDLVGHLSARLDTSILVVFRRASTESSPAMFALFAGVLTLAGVVEELFFRGYLQTRLSERWGAWPAIVVTALAFGLVHADLLQSPFAFLVGLFLGWVVERTGSLAPAILAHTANNALSALSARWLGGAQTTTEAHLWLPVWGLTLVAVVVALPRLVPRSAPAPLPSAPPPRGRSSSLAPVVVVLVTLALAGVTVLGALGFAGWRWIASGVEEAESARPAIMAEAAVFASDHDEQGCLDEARRRGRECEGIDLGCPMGVQDFLETCLVYSEPSPDLCDGTSGMTRREATAEWQGRLCDGDSVGEQISCQLLAAVLVNHCDDGR